MRHSGWLHILETEPWLQECALQSDPALPQNSREINKFCWTLWQLKSVGQGFVSCPGEYGNKFVTRDSKRGLAVMRRMNFFLSSDWLLAFPTGADSSFGVRLRTVLFGRRQQNIFIDHWVMLFRHCRRLKAMLIFGYLRFFSIFEGFFSIYEGVFNIF